ncbi:MAG: sigma-E processing peptidase SpoIIGA [Oscillospiraceae bacterium]
MARLTLLLFALSCALAGCVMALGVLAGSAVPMVNGIFYTDVDTKVLLIAAGSADLVLTVVFRAAARHNIEGEVLTVRICMEGKTIKLAALRDNGNSLREPMGGRPVLVSAYGALDTVLTRPVRQILTRERLGHSQSCGSH